MWARVTGAVKERMAERRESYELKVESGEIGGEDGGARRLW